MPPTIETIEAPQVTPATFPKWYTEAPLDDRKGNPLMDEVRTALIGYPDHAAIVELAPGCVRVHLRGEADRVPIMNFLLSKGFRLGAAVSWNEDYTANNYPRNYSGESNYIVVGCRP